MIHVNFFYFDVFFFLKYPFIHLALDLCAQSNRSCLNNGVCVINSTTLLPYCNCSSPSFNGTRCEV